MERKLSALHLPPARVELPGGTFLMGAEGPDSNPLDGEGPVRGVTVEGFATGAHAVTTAQFDRFVQDTGYVTEAEGFGVLRLRRVPASGTAPAGAAGAADSVVVRRAGGMLVPRGRHRCNIWQGTFPTRNDAADGYRGTAPVDAFEPNGYGLYNVAGNVWDMCADWWG